MAKGFYRGRSSTGSAYERELRRLLEGDRAALADFGKSLSVEESAAYESVLGRPFLVIRAAGSFGSDLVALRDDFSFPIEVKSSRERTIRFGGSRLAKQAAATGCRCATMDATDTSAMDAAAAAATKMGCRAARADAETASANEPASASTGMPACGSFATD